MANRKRKTRKKPPQARKSPRPTTPIGRDIMGMILLILALLSAAAVFSFHVDDFPNSVTSAPGGDTPANSLGKSGALVAFALVNFTFGRWLALIIPLLVGFAGFDLLRGQGMGLLKRTILPLLVTGVIGAISIGYMRTLLKIENPSDGQGSLSYHINGMVGYELNNGLQTYLGTLGTGILLAGLILIFVTILFRIKWAEVGVWIKQGFIALGALLARIRLPKLPSKPVRAAKPPLIRDKKKPKKQKEPEPEPEPAVEELDDDPVVHEKTAPTIVNTAAIKAKPAEKPKKSGKPEEEPDPSVYVCPESDLLQATSPEETVEVEESVLRNVAQSLEERLAEFGVKASVVAIHPGPVITRYDLKPAPGVKVSKITSLGDDLALSLSSTAVRIIAPIPGAGAVGVEVPNPDQGMVRLREIVESPEFTKASSPLAIALGKTAQGDDFVVDLAKMPHVLIAGTTGSGKSVCINTIIASILMRNHPQDVLIAMVDPKKIELSAYAELRRHHLLFLEDTDEVIATEPKNAVALLQSVVHEMEKRYDRLAETGARNLVEYNQYVKKGKVQPDEDGNEPKPLPYIVMIVDELADLMLTAARDVEEPIARLAQMARAVGIHLVVATQRPSVDVITGVIKANFPARIAFMVASKIDSRTILDRPGAEALLGRGDGLFLAGTSPQAIRFHGAFISTDEVHELIAHVHNQPMYVKPTTLTLPDTPGGGNGGGGDIEEDRDQLFAEAVRIVARHQQGSVSLLQRRLKIGYSRAGRLLDQLEQAGVVGPFEGSKAREVMIEQDQVDTFLAGDTDEE
ncbi:DNA translocase FtsK [bacterium]|nr:DNA translocase FtsK [bacterium]